MKFQRIVERIMPDLETAIRLIVIGQDLLIALILMLGRGRRNI